MVEGVESGIERGRDRMFCFLRLWREKKMTQMEMKYWQS